MKPTPIVPVYEYEAVSPDDLIGGISTLNGRSGQGVILPPPGDGPDKALSWAIQEVEQAARGNDPDQRDRLSADAMINARRSLACLVDWYLERDLATRCSCAPSSAKQKADFLVRRGIIDGLTANVLERAIARRNQLEHEYKHPTLDTAEDFVELLRRTIYAIRAESDPSAAPWIFGVFLYAMQFGGEEGRSAEFHGWTEPLVVLSRFTKDAWAGIVLPSKGHHAVVRRAFLKDFTTDHLVAMLALLERVYAKPSSFNGSQHCEVLAKAMNLQ
jgi:hypothetical protein